MDKKRIEDSRTEQTYLLMPKHINGYGKLFGGMLVEWIDEVAGIVARRHAKTEITTAAIDNLNFKHSASKGEMVVLIGRITYVGKTSMEVRVDTYVEDLNGIRMLINHAYIVMVSVDEKHKPLAVPGIYVETEVEKAEWEGGQKRYELRKKRRAEGF